MHRLYFIGGIWQAGREHFETLIRDDNIVFDKDSELFFRTEQERLDGKNHLGFQWLIGGRSRSDHDAVPDVQIGGINE